MAKAYRAMTDEPEQPDDDLGDMDVDTSSMPDWFEVEGAWIIAPRGWQDLQDHFGSPLVRINMKAPGTVDVLVSDDEGVSWKWRSVDKLKVPATVTALRGGKE